MVKKEKNGLIISDKVIQLNKISLFNVFSVNLAVKYTYELYY